MLRFLLRAGADPNSPKIAADNLVVFYAKAGDRERVDLLLSFGADAGSVNGKGESLTDLLSQARFPRQNFPPEAIGQWEAQIRELSEDLTVSPNQFVAQHRHTCIWSYPHYPLTDAELLAWATEVGRLLASTDLMEECIESHLKGAELEDGRMLIQKNRNFERRKSEQRRRQEEYIERFGLPFPHIPLDIP